MSGERNDGLRFCCDTMVRGDRHAAWCTTQRTGQGPVVADNSFAKAVAIAPTEPLAAPNPLCGIPGCARSVYHDHPGLGLLAEPGASFYGKSALTPEVVAKFDREFRNRVVAWAGSQGCPEGALVADWIEKQKVATPQFLETISSDIEQHVADRRLLAQALPALADLAAAHPEIATLCGEIKETLHPRSIASGVIVAVDHEKKRITIEDRP